MEDRTVVAHGCRKPKKIMCRMEVENVVFYGRLLSPPRSIRVFKCCITLGFKEDILKNFMLLQNFMNDIFQKSLVAHIPVWVQPFQLLRFVSDP